MAAESEMDLLPNYLIASTPELLRELMLENNLRLGSLIKYQDINQLLDGSFICWYYEKSTDFNSLMKRVRALTNDKKK